MTSYRKDVIRANEEHILGEFEDYDDNMSPEDAFVDQINYLAGRNGSIPDAIKMYFEGSPPLAYTDDIRKYLKKIGVDDGKTHDGGDVFDLYIHLLVRDGTKLYEKIVKGKYDNGKKSKTMKTSSRRCGPKSASAKSKKGTDQKLENALETADNAMIFLDYPSKDIIIYSDGSNPVEFAIQSAKNRVSDGERGTIAFFRGKSENPLWEGPMDKLVSYLDGKSNTLKMKSSKTCKKPKSKGSIPISKSKKTSGKGSSCRTRRP